MSRLLKTDNALAYSAPPAPTIAIRNPGFSSPSPNATATMHRVDSMECTSLPPHTQARDVLDAAGQLDEVEGLMVLQSIIFGILGMALVGALLTLFLIAS